MVVHESDVRKINFHYVMIDFWDKIDSNTNCNTKQGTTPERGQRLMCEVEAEAH